MSASYFAAFEQRAAAGDDGFLELFKSATMHRSLSFAAFGERIQGAAGELVSQGAGKGDIILIFAQNSVGMLASFFGAQLIGAIPAFMPPPTPRQDEKAWRASHRMLVDRLQPAIIVAEPDCLQAVSDMAGRSIVSTELIENCVAPAGRLEASAGLDDIAFLQHSSGTTGLKKGVMVTYRQLLAQTGEYADAIGLGEKNTVVSWLPLYHDMGLIAATLMPFTQGLGLKIIDTFFWLSNPLFFLRVLENTEASFSWMPNFAFPYLADRASRTRETFDLVGVCAIINCSEPCKKQSMAAFETVFVPLGLPENAVQVCYAMAEYVFAVTQTGRNAPPRILDVDREVLAREARALPVQTENGAQPIVSVGRMVGSAEVRIGNGLPDGAVGAISVRGASLCDGYYKAPDLSAKKFVDGWYLTGDLGFTFDGELYVTGRSDDVIIIRGRNYYAHDFEERLSAIDGLKPGRVVAFGLEDARSGTQQLLIAAEASGDDHDALDAAVRQTIFMEFGVSPTDVLLLPAGSLIKTSSGKISRIGNAEAYRSGSLSPWRAER